MCFKQKISFLILQSYWKRPTLPALVVPVDQGMHLANKCMINPHRCVVLFACYSAVREVIQIHISI